MGQNRTQIRDTLGVAGSMASGIIEYLADGTWTKRLHPGWAAQAGLRAAQLGAAGFRGPGTVFEGTHGLFSARSEEHTSELQSLMRISYAVFCLQKQQHTQIPDTIQIKSYQVTPIKQ